MLRQVYRFFIVFVCLALATVAVSPASASNAAQQSPDVQPTLVAGAIQWPTLAGYTRVVVTLSRPDGSVVRHEFPAGVTPALSLVDAQGNALPDGSYSYELQLIRGSVGAIVHAPDVGRDAAVQAAAADAKSALHATTVSGSFALSQGALAGGDEVEAEPSGGVQASGVDAVDQVINTDLTVRNSLCVGFDCVDAETFGSDTIRLKENQLRIHFDDTSAAGFPNRDWRIIVNDPASGGANKFSIEDSTGSLTPFTLIAGAPNNSIFVDSGGRVGFRTATPVLDLHVATGNTPALRLEQNGASGFTAQTWDIAGNEANFFVRDVTSGSRLPFRIRPGAPTSSIDIASDGDVGVGTASPSAALHVRRSDATTQVFIQETSAITANRTLLALENKGGSRVTFNNIGTSKQWMIGTSGDDRFIFDFLGSGSAEMQLFSSGLLLVGPSNPKTLRLDTAGNLQIMGTLTENAVFGAQSAQAADQQAVLAKLANVPVITRQSTEYPVLLDQNGEVVDADAIQVQRMRPSAAEFYAAFGLGAGAEQIAPMDVASVALAGVQEQTREIAALRSQVSSLQQQNAQLQERLAAIETALGISVQQPGGQGSALYLPAVQR